MTPWSHRRGRAPRAHRAELRRRGEPGASGPGTQPTSGVRVQIENISLRYATGTDALKNVSLSLPAGEFLSLVGPSGCGKSSLLRVVAGLAESTAGTLDVAPPPAKGEVGVVFQDPTLLPWRSARRNVEFPLQLQGIAEGIRVPAALEMLEQVGLGDAPERLPRELSGGMRMRVALARAAVCRPRLMLLDEPFGALDEMTRERLQVLVMNMWLASRFTAIFVTHSIREAVFLGQRVGVMVPGELTAIVEVPLPFPRDDDMRTGRVFNDTVRKVIDALAA